jgi:hypothetical protein
MREIRRAQRDPFKVHLKATAPHTPDRNQLSLPFFGRWPEDQIDLEEYLAALPGKRAS